MRLLHALTHTHLHLHTLTHSHTHTHTHTHTQDVESKRTLAAMCRARGHAPPSFATGPHHWAALDHCPFAHSLSAAGILSLSLSLSLSLFSSPFSSLSLRLSLSSSLSLPLSLPLTLFLSLFLSLSLSLFLSSLPHSLSHSLSLYMYKTTYVLLRHHSVCWRKRVACILTCKVHTDMQILCCQTCAAKHTSRRRPLLLGVCRAPGALHTLGSCLCGRTLSRAHL